MPGPTTQACTRPASTTDGAATTSGQRASTASARGPANLTKPGRRLTAAPTQSTAAPGYFGEPATTPSTPEVYLLDSAPGAGIRSAASASSKATRSASPVT